MLQYKPNILFTQADQLKPQVLPMHGGPALTPNIESLADGGVVFDNAYCNFPLCAPSRFSMLSGMLPSRIGAYDNGAEFLAQIPTVAHYLRMAGYKTCLAGKQHFVGPDMLHGFHQRLVPELYPIDFCWTPLWGEERMESNNDATGTTRAGICERSVQIDHDEAVLYQATAKLHDYARDRSQPFFLVASFTNPHEPYYCQPKHWNRYRHEDVPMPATPLQPAESRELHTERMLAHHALLDESITDARVRVARHAYLGNVSYVDDMIGRLIATLQATGLYENTVIVVTADHGDMLGEQGLWFKKHFLDHCAKVPLIIVSPDGIGGRHRFENVSLVDVLPTLCEVAELDAAELAPELPDGKSLLPLCRGAAVEERPVCAEITSEGVPSPMYMVREGQNKLIVGGDAPPILFDLDADPQELTNLASLVHLREVRSRLQSVVEATWDVENLVQDIRRSQRRRRLVDAAHGYGDAPCWELQDGDAQVPWLLRRPGLYNDWAWFGIEE